MTSGIICIICLPRDKNELVRVCSPNPDLIILAATDAFVGHRFDGVVLLPGIFKYIERERGATRLKEWQDYLFTKLRPGARITELF